MSKKINIRAPLHAFNLEKTRMFVLYDRNVDGYI